MDNNFKEFFRTRIIRLAGVGLFLACICVACIAIWPLYKELRHQYTNSLIYAVKIRGMVAEEFVSKIKATARQITSRTKARQALEKYNRREIDLAGFQKYIRPILQDALNLSESAVGITRLDHKRTPVVQVGLALPPTFLQQTDLSKYKAPFAHGLFTIAEKKLIVVSAPIMNRRNVQVGTDVVLFKPAELIALVKDYTGFGKSGESLLLAKNADGNGKPLFAGRFKTLPDFSHILSKINDAVNSDTIHLYETESDYISYAQLQGIDFVMVVRMAKDELHEPINKQISKVILLISVLIIPLGLAGLVILMRPLRNRTIVHIDTLQNALTAKEQAEQHLLDEKERLNVTLCSIGDGVIATDKEGNIVLINKVSEKLTGWSQQESVGLPVQDVFNITDERTDKPSENPVHKVLKTGRPSALGNHTILIAKDGTHYRIEYNAAPIFDQESNIVGIVLVYRDITEKKRIAGELLKVKKLESVGVLAGGIAHDFNNILTAILGNIELAEMYTDTGHKAHRLLTKAKEASLRAKDLTQQLLTFAKGGDPVKQASSIGKIIKEAADLILHDTSVRGEYDIPDNLWQVEVDTGQISQVIQNMAMNAGHATPGGGVIRIRCQNIEDIAGESSSLPAGKYIKITIADSGSGIPEKYIDKIFDPFFSTKQQGAGLGLAICHSIISKHKGSISVQSEANKGALFNIYLPVGQITDQDTALTDPDIDGAEHKATIMVMDDEAIVRDMVKQMLSHLGHKVLLVENGHEAIVLYSEHMNTPRSIDIIIMDLTISGGMGGKEAVKEILQVDPNAKVIVASGYSNDPVLAHYQDYGFKASLAKPFQLAALHRVINEVLGLT